MANSVQLCVDWGPSDDPGFEQPWVTIEKDSPVSGNAADKNLVSFTPTICAEPRCGCNRIHLEPRPDGGNSGTGPAGAGPCWLDLDLEQLILATGQTGENQNENLRLADENWIRLRNWYLREKLFLILNTPTKEIDRSKLPSNSRMVSFAEVFPFGLVLRFSHGGKTWAVDELYCVQDNCDCKSVALDFLEVPAGGKGRPQSVPDAPAIRFDYGTDEVESVDCGNPPNPREVELLKALRMEHPMLTEELEHRHLFLQNIYLHQTADRLKAEIHQRKRAAGKVGRNDPCPCGSGRKYKRCCLA